MNTFTAYTWERLTYFRFGGVQYIWGVLREGWKTAQLTKSIGASTCGLCSLAASG